MTGKFSEGFEVDEKKAILEIIEKGESTESHSGKAHRYHGKNRVVLIPREKNIFQPEIIERNVQILKKLHIPFPNTRMGYLELSELGYNGKFLVLEKEEVRDFQSTLEGDSMTKHTMRLIEGAVEIVDKAAKEGVVLDNSFHNFGLKGETVFLDFNDEDSINQAENEEEIKGMYQGFLDSFYRINHGEDFDPARFIAEKSEVIENVNEIT